jgi:cyclopropane fatty-acyl-phospholipid synthase-like methyltransferase
MDYSKEQFRQFWSESGYKETWDGFKYNWSNEIQSLIKQQIGDNKDKIVLEIGCGAGYWTSFLCENSNLVYAIDLIPRPQLDYSNFIYYENQNLQFNCKSIKEDSIDFVFSFGVFCHFSKSACEEYLTDIFRVLKKGGSAILMYSDDKSLAKFYNQDSFRASSVYGDSNDYKDIMPTLKKYDENATKILDFKDALVLVKK